ncbi:MAG: AI-2E family transporter, partial [Candidatus Marinimicrobia bacterium CG08_land_8_20_14_0_20_45_22]
MKTRQNFASIADGWESRSHIKTIVLIVATVCGGYLCYRIAVPFLSVLVWAIVLAVLFNPLQRWLELKLKHPNLAAVVCIIMIGLVVVLPATFVGQRLVQQVVNGAQLITANVKSGDWRHALENRPRIAYLAGRIEQQYDLPETVVKLNNWLTNTAGSVVKGSVVQVIGLCLTFYLLFFFLRDRRKALQSFRYLSPLTEAEMDRLLSRVNDTINAT